MQNESVRSMRKSDKWSRRNSEPGLRSVWEAVGAVIRDSFFFISALATVDAIHELFALSSSAELSNFWDLYIRIFRRLVGDLEGIMPSWSDSQYFVLISAVVLSLLALVSKATADAVKAGDQADDEDGMMANYGVNYPAWKLSQILAAVRIAWCALNGALITALVYGVVDGEPVSTLILAITVMSSYALFNVIEKKPRFAKEQRNLLRIKHVRQACRRRLETLSRYDRCDWLAGSAVATCAVAFWTLLSGVFLGQGPVSAAGMAILSGVFVAATILVSGIIVRDYFMESCDWLRRVFFGVLAFMLSFSTGIVIIDWSFETKSDPLELFGCASLILMVVFSIVVYVGVYGRGPFGRLSWFPARLAVKKTGLARVMVHLTDGARLEDVHKTAVVSVTALWVDGGEGDGLVTEVAFGGTSVLGAAVPMGRRMELRAEFETAGPASDINWIWMLDGKPCGSVLLIDIAEPVDLELVVLPATPDPKGTNAVRRCVNGRSNKGCQP